MHSIFYELVICSSLFVIPKLDGEPVADTAEGGGLHLPVVDGVAIQADAVVERPLHPKATRAEVIHGHMVDVVGMEIDHLKVFHVWEACRNPSEAVVVQVQLSQPWQVGQTAVLNVAEVIETKSQSVEVLVAAQVLQFHSLDLVVVEVKLTQAVWKIFWHTGQSGL